MKNKKLLKFLLLFTAIALVGLYWGCNETLVVPEKDSADKIKIYELEQRLTKIEAEKNQKEIDQLRKELAELKAEKADQ
jgi:hypothetical protein